MIILGNYFTVRDRTQGLAVGKQDFHYKRASKMENGAYLVSGASQRGTNAHKQTCLAYV